MAAAPYSLQLQRSCCRGKVDPLRRRPFGFCRKTRNTLVESIIGSECPHESYRIVSGGANVGKLWMGRYDLELL